MPRAHALQQEQPLQWGTHAPQLEKAYVQQQRLSAAKERKKDQSWETQGKMGGFIRVKTEKSTHKKKDVQRKIPNQ